MKTELSKLQLHEFLIQKYINSYNDQCLILVDKLTAVRIIQKKNKNNKITKTTKKYKSITWLTTSQVKAKCTLRGEAK